MSKENENLNEPQNGNDFIADVSGSFFLISEKKPSESGKYHIITRSGRVIKANFKKGDKIATDVWFCDYEDHRLNEGVLAWGFPVNYR